MANRKERLKAAKQDAIDAIYGSTPNRRYSDGYAPCNTGVANPYEENSPEYKAFESVRRQAMSMDALDKEMREIYG